jgi:hypothetical protein
VPEAAHHEGQRQHEQQRVGDVIDAHAAEVNVRRKDGQQQRRQQRRGPVEQLARQQIQRRDSQRAQHHAGKAQPGQVVAQYLLCVKL